MENLNKLLDCLSVLRDKDFNENYYIPSLWLNPSDKNPGNISVHPADFYSTKIEEILNSRMNTKTSNRQFAYNMFIRYTAGYDHDGNNQINTDAIDGIWRETGTILKAIAILPYIKSLGCNIIYLLPVTSIGRDGRKGSLGSPYAIADPYKLDDYLADNIPGITIEEQFTAFIEAAHLLGFKVITEFVFRTASIDSPLAMNHPEWFYWLREDVYDREGYTDHVDAYGPPYFSEEILSDIKNKINNNDFSELPEPDDNYQSLFTEVPENVFYENGRIRGLTKDGRRCKIPSAFADWPPDDDQPVWSDVTYLRLFDSDKFNYIAYNTVRMYDTELNRADNIIQSVWEHISGIVPYYIEKYDIDGVMIDMGHALPDELLSEIIKRARQLKPDFILWEENFSLSAESRKKGFDASLGYMPFDQNRPDKMKEIIEMLAWGANPIPFFLTPESHNTKRAASRTGSNNFTKYSWAINCFLPGILFIHSGFELGESKPVNTGLGFEPDEISDFPPDKLPLFSEASLNWNSDTELLGFIKKVYRIAQENDIINITPVQSLNPDVIAFIAGSLVKEIIVIASFPDSQPRNTMLSFVNEYSEITSYLDEKKIEIKGSELILSLKPNAIIIGEIS